MRTVVRILVIAALLAGFGALLNRALDIEYGPAANADCAHVTITGDTWTPLGWNVADGFTGPLLCPHRGQTVRLFEDGSVGAP
jgi:hypothetical protein